MDFFKKDENPNAWLGTQRARLENDLPRMDFNSAIAALQEFEDQIEHTLVDLQATNDKGIATFKRQLICELAVVNKQTAMQHLGNGNDEKYLEYHQRSQNYLTECAALKKTAE